MVFKKFLYVKTITYGRKTLDKSEVSNSTASNESFTVGMMIYLNRKRK